MSEQPDSTDIDPKTLDQSKEDPEADKDTTAKEAEQEEERQLKSGEENPT